MTRPSELPVPTQARLRRVLWLTWAGMIAERVTRAFWPVWSVLAAGAAALLLGLHEMVPPEAEQGAAAVLALAVLGLAIRGARLFSWPMLCMPASENRAQSSLTNTEHYAPPFLARRPEFW